jgi:hypothetical protein
MFISGKLARTLFGAGCVAATLAMSAAPLHDAHAGAIPTALPDMAATKPISQATAFTMAPPALPRYAPAAKPVFWLPLLRGLRRLAAILRQQAIGSGIVTALEKIADDLAKRVPRAELQRALCKVLSDLDENVGRNPSLKAAARAEMLDLISGLKKTAGCSSLP